MTTKSKNIFLSIGLLFIIVLVLSACNQKKEGESTVVKYKLAVMVPETGNLAFIGQPIRNALILASEEMKDKLHASNVDIELFFADTQGNPREAVTQFNRVADVEKANGIITILSGVISAINPLAKDRDILLLGLTPDPTFLDENSKAVRIYYSFEKEGNQLADVVISRGWKKVLLLHSTDAATTYQISKVLRPKLEKSGVKLSVDTFHVGQRDFKALTAKYAGEKWDGIILHGFGSELPFVGEAFLAYPNLAKVSKLGSFGTLDTTPELRKNLQGINFFAPAFMGKASPEYESFAKTYADRYKGMTPTHSSIYAYDAYLLLANALAKQASTNSKVLKNELLNQHKALSQDYQFNANGDFLPDTVMMEIASDGSFKPVSETDK